MRSYYFDEHRHLLIADFQKLYSVNIVTSLNTPNGGMRKSEVSFLGNLYHALLSDGSSAFVKAKNPDFELDYSARLLRMIELNQRREMWGNSNSKTRGKQPEPIPTPKETIDQHEREEKLKRLVESGRVRQDYYNFLNRKKGKIGKARSVSLSTIMKK